MRWRQTRQLLSEKENQLDLESFFHLWVRVGCYCGCWSVSVLRRLLTADLQWNFKWDTHSGLSASGWASCPNCQHSDNSSSPRPTNSEQWGGRVGAGVKGGRSQDGKLSADGTVASPRGKSGTWCPSGIVLTWQCSDAVKDMIQIFILSFFCSSNNAVGWMQGDTATSKELKGEFYSFILFYIKITM